MWPLFFKVLVFVVLLVGMGQVKCMPWLHHMSTILRSSCSVRLRKRFRTQYIIILAFFLSLVGFGVPLNVYSQAATQSPSPTPTVDTSLGKPSPLCTDASYEYFNPEGGNPEVVIYFPSTAYFDALPRAYVGYLYFDARVNRSWRVYTTRTDLVLAYWTVWPFTPPVVVPDAEIYNGYRTFAASTFHPNAHGYFSSSNLTQSASGIWLCPDPLPQPTSTPTLTRTATPTRTGTPIPSPTQIPLLTRTRYPTMTRTVLPSNPPSSACVAGEVDDISGSYTLRFEASFYNSVDDSDGRQRYIMSSTATYFWWIGPGVDVVWRHRFPDGRQSYIIPNRISGVPPYSVPSGTGVIYVYGRDRLDADIQASRVYVCPFTPASVSPSPTRTATVTRTSKPSVTATVTMITRTPTNTRTTGPTRTPTMTRTPTVTRTPSPTWTAGPTGTPEPLSIPTVPARYTVVPLAPVPDVGDIDWSGTVIGDLADLLVVLSEILYYDGNSLCFSFGSFLPDPEATPFDRIPILEGYCAFLEVASPLLQWVRPAVTVFVALYFLSQVWRVIRSLSGGV